MRNFKKAKTGSLAVTDKPEQAIRHLAMAMDRVEAFLEDLAPSIRKWEQGLKSSSAGEEFDAIQELRGRQIATNAFPVGSIFVTVSTTPPAELLGYGTWEAFGAGRVLVGLDPSNPNFNPVEKIG